MPIFSHMIFYIKDVPNAVAYYREAFGFEPKLLHESGQYAEINTGQTVIAFAAEELARTNLPIDYIPLDLHKPPFACEIVFTVDIVEEAYKKALDAGGIAVAIPQRKPWGQEVAYVRDPNGILIELVGAILG